MIAVPWQVVLGILALLAVGQVIRHVRQTDCEERIRAARTEERRETLAAYRDTYRRAWRQAQHDCRLNQDQEIRRVMREIQDETGDSDS